MAPINREPAAMARGGARNADRPCGLIDSDNKRRDGPFQPLSVMVTVEPGTHHGWEVCIRQGRRSARPLSYGLLSHARRRADSIAERHGWQRA